ncbi:MAG TPA: shikimate kinase [Chryseosolibacter sp.]|nr:shikimate kinase [Chryseosolibacter sp.]
MKIFLIGMPGSGKTTLGNELASHLMVDFVDLDAEIERAEQRSIAEIFREQGEEYFRLVEARLLRDWAASTHSFVMATGGGTPCFYDGMETINQHGVSIFLDFPVPVLIDRVKRNQERPLLLTSTEVELKERLERMREGRLDCYRKAKIVIENPSIDTLLQSLHAKR